MENRGNHALEQNSAEWMLRMMSRKFIPYVLLFLASFGGALAFRELREIRHSLTRVPSSHAFATPTPTDVAAARPSDILTHGAARDEELGKRYVDRCRKDNLFGLKTLITETTEEEIAAAAVSGKKFMQSYDRVTFYAKVRMDKKTSEFLLHFRKKADHTYGGVNAVSLEVHDSGKGLIYHRPATCANELSRYHPQWDSLVMYASMDPMFEGKYTGSFIEFPMRNEAKLSGRYFSWNVDREDVEVVGEVEWTRLDPDEAKRRFQQWNQAWMTVDETQKIKTYCLGPADPATNGPVPY